MAAMLERNGRNGKPSPSNLPHREIVHCHRDDCESSYTLFYTDVEDYAVGSVKNVYKMRASAVELIRNDHPSHFTKTYLWKAIGAGPECRWVEADSLAARAAL
jgi:hypothetical protein